MSMHCWSCAAVIARVEAAVRAAARRFVDRLALAAGYLDAFQALDPDATALMPLITRTTERADVALSTWRQWQREHLPKASA